MESVVSGSKPGNLDYELEIELTFTEQLKSHTFPVFPAVLNQSFFAVSHCLLRPMEEK